MSNYVNFINTVNGLLLDAKDRKVINLNVNNLTPNSNQIILEDQEVVNFGSCSYLGLEFDERIKQGSIDAIQKFGTQFSSSRAYLSVGLYEEYEDLLSKVFDANVIVTPTTSLGHIAAIPNQVGDNDAVIVDHQVHTSVQVAVSLLKPRKIHVELVRHNNMEKLEDRIIELSKKHDKVWYMADGVYSMYGDILKHREVNYLLNRYNKFHLYVDDAHGMSVAGKHGRGITLDKMELHPKMIVATSFAKGFATGGAALIFPHQSQIDITRNCASPLVTSGPLQPAVLGAGIAAAKIHLTDEIYSMQNDLMDNINLTNLLLQKSSLPAVFNSQTPIFFVGTSIPKVAYNIISKMKECGHYLNLGMFPAVPMKNTGVRFTITKLHTFDQIAQMVKDLEQCYHIALIEENMDESKIYKAFNLITEEGKFEKDITQKLEANFSLRATHKKSIENIDKKDWNRAFSGVGSFDWNGLKLLEDTFQNNFEEHDNWEFDYVVVRDKMGKTVAATFLTTTLTKDDMFAPAEASAIIEQKRLKDPNYLVSKTLFMGSLFSEGNHLYLDQNHPQWKGAMSLIFEKIDRLKSKYNAENLILRDFDNVSEELNQLFIDNGFYKMELPNRWENSNIEFQSEEEFISNLTRKRKRQLRLETVPFQDDFSIINFKGNNNIAEERIDKWYKLYQNVKNKSLNLNTFALPKKLFKALASSKDWDILEIKDPSSKEILAVGFSNINNSTYSSMLIGLNYNANSKGSVYRQALYQFVKRANELKMDKINLGFSAGVEKKKVGCNPVTSYAYLCTDSTFSQSVISNVSTTFNKKEAEI